MTNRKRSATLKDVAAHAGVSIKTVSNVVNDWPYVTDETRQKVWEAIQVTGYRPNQAARSLVTGRTRSIGVIIPDISNPFFGLAVRGCEDVLFAADYSLFLCNTNEDVEREKSYLELMLRRGVDAIILWGSRLRCEELEQINATSLPLITVEHSEAPTQAGHTCINVANVDGGRLATGHLAEQGYRRIAHLGGPHGRITAMRRLQGYRQALDAHGLPYDPELVRFLPPSTRSGYKAALEILQGDKPDAFFCYNDLIAVGALLATRELGLDVPGQVGIVGFDDILMASLTEPPLTTVRIPQYSLGKLTGQVVLESLENRRDEPQTIDFPVELLVRASSGRDLFDGQARQEMLSRLVSAISTDPDPIGDN